MKIIERPYVPFCRLPARQGRLELTPEIVRIAAGLSPKPELIVTVDNGTSSIAGVAEAKRLGREVLITDHHLPGETLPQAQLIVNPNRRDCGFGNRGSGVQISLPRQILRSDWRGRCGQVRGQSLEFPHLSSQQGAARRSCHHGERLATTRSTENESWLLPMLSRTYPQGRWPPSPSPRSRRTTRPAISLRRYAALRELTITRVTRRWRTSGYSNRSSFVLSLWGARS